jgi:hypothetical protein
MKNISTTQAIFAALFIIKVAMPFTSSASQRVNAVIYQNQSIPAVELKEIEISASRLATLCKVKNYQGELIPSVEMKEVTISASGTSVEESEGLIKVEMPGMRTRAIAWNGNLIPDVDGPEVTISADRYLADLGESDENRTAENGMIFKVSARQTFDRVGGFLLEETKQLIRRFIPGQF